MFLFLYQTVVLSAVSGEQVYESSQPRRAFADSVHGEEKEKEKTDQIDFKCYFFLSGDFSLPLPVSWNRFWPDLELLRSDLVLA